MSDNSECSLIEQNMNDFIGNRLVGVDLWVFLNHILTCPACYEELETRYLLSEVLQRLEDGETIDLCKELGDKVNNSRRILRFHRQLDCIQRTMQIMAAIFATFGFYELIIWYFNL